MELNIDKPITLNELKQLHKFLSSECDCAEPMTITEAHGFLTAILSAPTLIMPSKWQPVLFGGHPEFKSQEQAMSVIGLVNRFYNAINSELRSSNDIFNILLFENGNIVPVEQASLDLAKEWCRGYLEGVELDKFWSDDKEGDKLLLPFAVIACQAIFTGGIGNGVKNKDSDPFEEVLKHRKEAWSLLPSYVKEVYGYWLNRRNSPIEDNDEIYDNTKIRGTSKIGRNESCPCGSGKKYKKCCLLKEEVLH